MASNDARASVDTFDPSIFADASGDADEFNPGDGGAVSEAVGTSAGTGPASAFVEIDPGAISGTDRPERVEPVKRRGRKAGTKNKASKKSSNLAGVLANSIVMGHALLCSQFTVKYNEQDYLTVPELSITQPEADQLGLAFDAVLAQYDFGVSEKAEAWYNLTMILATVYGGRYAMYKLRTSRQRQLNPQPQPQAQMSFQ